MKLATILMAAATLTLAMPAQAKELDQVRIYINPGHGGWGSGDRHMGTVKHGPADYSDTTGFFETNTNLWKGLATLQRLSEYGFKYDPTLNQKPEGAEETLWRWGAARDMSQGLVMSHVKLGTSRDINEIAMEVEANNFDFFISIHSNAHADGKSTNYPALFIRGENKTESVEGSADACRTIWPYAYSNTHACWSNYSMTNVALYYDIDFWSGDYAITHHPTGDVKGYYAVLRHNVKGLLCEGYFHTYQPARHRAMNMDVCRIEGEAYARGIADIFGVEKEKTGDIYGIVRDKHERFKHQFYNAPASSPDAYKPLNNVDVVLKDAAGKQVATYKTDDEWNGAFVFRKLPVGKYTIEVKAEGYKDMEPEYAGPFEVKECTTLYPKVYLESETYTPPAVVYRDYEDELAGDDAIHAADEYNFSTAVADRDLAQLKDKTVRRMIAKGDKIYVLAHDAQKVPTLLVLDATTLDVKAEVSTEGTEGTECNVADIAVTADGVLIASAAELCHINGDQVEEGETLGECNIYKWTNDDKGLPTGAPAKWMGLGITANFYRAYTGFTIAYTGTSTEGSLIIPSASTYYNKKVWLNVVDVAEGAYSASRFVNQTRDLMNIDDLGKDMTISISPNDSNAFIVNSSKIKPIQFGLADYAVQQTAVADVPANEGYFKFAGHSFVAVSDVDADGKQCGVRMADITGGVNRLAEITTANTTIEAVQAPGATAGRTVVERNGDEEITGWSIDLYALRDGKVSRFTTKGVDQPVVRGNWAYGLKQTIADNKAELTFSLTDDAIAAVQLVPAADNTTGAMIVADNGEFKKGENTVEVDLTTLEGNYTWQVVVDNKAVPAVGLVFDSGICSSGVAIDMNTESDNFGAAYVSQKDGSRGIRAFKADLTPVNAEPYLAGKWDTSVGASPWRLAVMPTGKLLISDWGDKQGGMYLMDPATPATRSNFFAGTCKSSSGEWIYNGATIGGSTSGMVILGKGADTRIVSFQEDWPSDYSRNLVTYDLGEKEQIDFQPTQSDAQKTLSAKLINGNVDILKSDKGYLLGQVRGSGNNTEGVPSFVLADNDFNLVFNSGKDLADLTGSTGCFAMSADGKRIIVQDAGETMHVYDVDWSGDAPVLKPSYKFSVLTGGGSDVNSYQAAFDPAGNLYVANRSSFRVLSLPREAAKAVTPAKSTMILKGNSAISDIAVEADSNAPVRYYNLQGIEMPVENLPAGIYIRRQGNTSTKVIVK